MSDFLQYFLFRVVSGLARLLPYRVVGTIGAFLGSVVFHLTAIRKRVTLENLSLAFPQASAKKLRTMAGKAYENYGRVLLEMLWAGSQSAGELKRVMRVTNQHIVENALARGKGVILLSGHFGNWELSTTSLQLHLDRPLTIIVHTQRNKKIDSHVNANRTRFGNRVVPMERSIREVLKVLHDGAIVALLGDQSGPRESVFVEFFGRPASTHRGPAAFSLRSGAPLLMGFLVRQGDGTYELTFEEVERAGIEEYTEENVEELTRRHAATLERWIRQYPDHWLWMHKRWKHTAYYHERQRVEAGV